MTISVPTAVVQYGSVTCRFVLPTEGEHFAKLIRSEFMLNDDIPIGLFLSGEGDERSSHIFASNSSEVTVVPFDIEVLKQLSSDNTFHLRIYSKSNRINDSKLRSVQSTVTAQYDFNGKDATEISFSAGDRIVVEHHYSDDWWKGHVLSRPTTSGFFPSNYVSSNPSSVDKPAVSTSPSSESVCNYQDDEYFEGYANLGIHLEMLQDSSRTLAYKNAVDIASEFMKDKVVLDIGCGSGVLSIFCAKAGAAHVYAIDASSVIDHARVVVKENDLVDKITLIKGKIEEILLPVNQVDVIISEWMGTLLICESMIASVLWARQKYLRPGGLMIPEISNIMLAPIDVSDFYNSKIKFWDDVYSIKMSGLKMQASKDFFAKPTFDRILLESECLCEAQIIQSIDMGSANVESLETITNSFSFVAAKSGTCHGFGGWFDCVFSSAPGLNKPGNVPAPIVLSTSPSNTPTHWRQVTFVLATPLDLKKGDAIDGFMQIRRQTFWRRHFEVEIVFTVGDSREPIKQVFPLWR